MFPEISVGKKLTQGAAFPSFGPWRARLAGLALGATVSLGVSAAAETTTTFLRERSTGIIDTLTDEVRRHMRPAALNSRFTTTYFASLERMRRSEHALYLSAAIAVHPQLCFSGYFSPNGDSFLYQRNG